MRISIISHPKLGFEGVSLPPRDQSFDALGLKQKKTGFTKVYGPPEMFGPKRATIPTAGWHQRCFGSGFVVDVPGYL